jgi:flagellar protein FlaF
MGLDTVIVAFFVIGTILVVACTLTMGANHLIKSSYDGYIATTQTTMDRLHTDIKINGTQFNGTTNHIHLTVENIGETKLNNFDLWDIIVVNLKNGHASYLRKNERLNEGFNLAFTEDIINPGILDPHEIIDIELLPEFNSSDSLFIKIITENGIASSTNYVAGG